MEVLFKPVSPRELLRVIRSVLDTDLRRAQDVSAGFSEARG
jgi:DNA-binding response OmpR family regulator